MVSLTKYGRCCVINGQRHPVGTWTDLPEEEFRKLKKEERRFYENEKGRFEQDRETYNQMSRDVVKDPTKWWTSRVGYLEPDRPFQVMVNGLSFYITLTEKEIKGLYLFPKSEWVCKAVREGIRNYSYSRRHGCYYPDWKWSSQLSVTNGEIRIERLRAFLILPSSVINPLDYESREAISEAIAAESPNGTYILYVKDHKHITSKKNGRRYLLLEVEILDKQARGYVGSLFFDESKPYALERLNEIERALRIKHGLWQEMENAKNDYRIQGPKQLEWPYFKARLDFSGNYLGLENPRKVEAKEVEEWL